ncbi:MAG: ComF family protein [Candidatus Brennerbacteria bacterium]|nr:ComF family protein [Candidatus Brennerbacteria bacterium]
MASHPFIRALLDILFPPLCVACGTHLADERETVCANCLARIPRFGWRLCPVCDARIPDGQMETVGETPACHPDARYTLIAVTSYATPETQALVKALKYEGMRRVALTLALLTVVATRDTLGRAPIAGAPWRIVPVPLHAKRERERGFNQSALFAEALQHHEPFRNATVIHALRRTRHTETQTEKPDYHARRANVAGCFEIADTGAIRGSNILLIDDVTTSGATLEEAARVLKSAGAKNIIALVFARA